MTKGLFITSILAVTLLMVATAWSDDSSLQKAKEVEIKRNGKTDIDFSSDRFKPFIRYGKIHWKSGNNITKPIEWYYIKPFSMADKNWLEYLPAYFKDKEKIENSHCLYGQE